jgi:hypothetical protein
MEAVLVKEGGRVYKSGGGGRGRKDGEGSKRLLQFMEEKTVL